MHCSLWNGYWQNDQLARNKERSHSPLAITRIQLEKFTLKCEVVGETSLSELSPSLFNR